MNMIKYYTYRNHIVRLKKSLLSFSEFRQSIGLKSGTFKSVSWMQNRKYKKPPAC
jgi:hypothetical protein